MEVFERIHFFRKYVIKMTQSDFAKKINISRSNIASIETGRVIATPRVISDICNAFSLSEHWLRTGEGEMYEETETTLFSAFAKQYDLSEAEQKAAKYLLQLSSDERQQILRHIIGLSEAITSADQKIDVADIDTELEAYKKELLAEAKAQSASATGDEKENEA